MECYASNNSPVLCSQIPGLQCFLVTVLRMRHIVDHEFGPAPSVQNVSSSSPAMRWQTPGRYALLRNSQLRNRHPHNSLVRIRNDSRPCERRAASQQPCLDRWPFTAHRPRYASATLDCAFFHIPQHRLLPFLSLLFLSSYAHSSHLWTPPVYFYDVALR